jgi:outer membrane protein OmpA-like peptidoglycan-associated protein
MVDFDHAAAVARKNGSDRLPPAPTFARIPAMRGRLLGIVLLVGMGALSGCSMFTTKQEPFPALDIQATRPPPGPDKVVLTASNIVIQDKVQFEKGSAAILAVSHPLLDEVAKVFKENTQIEEVQIEGHTDSTGSPEFNKKLSQQRAESVMKYIATKGVKASRMTAMGYGPDRPIADNADPAGQEMNRRVEFVILKQGPKKTIVKDE